MLSMYEHEIRWKQSEFTQGSFGSQNQMLRGVFWESKLIYDLVLTFNFAQAILLCDHVTALFMLI